MTVLQIDGEAADEIIEVKFDNSHSIYAYEIATILAAHREQAVAEMVEQGQFLVDRLRDFEQQMQDTGEFREFNGHVSPAIARFEFTLTKANGDA